MEYRLQKLLGHPQTVTAKGTYKAEKAVEW